MAHCQLVQFRFHLLSKSSTGCGTCFYKSTVVVVVVGGMGMGL